jgi:hypothetical protein
MKSMFRNMRTVVRAGAVTLVAISVMGSAYAADRSYGLGGNYTFKQAPSHTPPPSFSMPPNRLGATEPPRPVQLRDLRPVSPPSPAPAPYVAPPAPKTTPYIGPPPSQTPGRAEVGVENKVNPTTTVRTGVEVAPNLPPRTAPPTIEGGKVQIEKQIK